MSKLGTYPVSGQAGNENMAGAPLLHFSLLVVSATGKISGHAMISQAIAPPYSERYINNVTGQVRAAGLGPVTKLVSLKGTYLDVLPPPAIGTIEVPFEASFAVNNEWTGRGSFSCGTTHAEDVPVKTTPQ